MNIDIWSDYVCPFCWVGKRNLEIALREFEHADAVTITWHPFELDPHAPTEVTGTLVEKIAQKYNLSLEQSLATQKGLQAKAKAVGLDFNYEEAKATNTFDAHRLSFLASKFSLADVFDDAAKKAYFTDGKSLAHHDTLVELATSVGLPKEEVLNVLASDAYSDEVRQSEETARRLGVTGVPFYVFNNTIAVSGAQPPGVFVEALRQAWAAGEP